MFLQLQGKGVTHHQMTHDGKVLLGESHDTCKKIYILFILLAPLLIY